MQRWLTWSRLAVARFARPRLAASVLAPLALIAVIGAIGLLAQTRVQPPAYHGPTTFWHDQCIDTMKTSRDKAREWGKRADLAQLVDAQTSLVAATGANCIAIDTPYDAEFLPVLRTWVASARSHHLRVWFRGNFSGWEGWFDYPRELTRDQLLAATRDFIAANPGLFADDDIFTPAPEAENGGPFKPAGSHFTADYRGFLIAETTTSNRAFAAIGKHVGTNWASMSGGVARSTLNQPTINALGGLVALDHYVPTAADMGSELDHYHQTFGARLVVGEWGAPIPDINGTLTSDEQVALVTDILAQMAARSSFVTGVNYWTLTGGSTGLVDDNLTKRPVYQAISRYYHPTVLSGTIRNNRGHAVTGATVTIDGQIHTTTDKHGNFTVLSPSGRTRIAVEAAGYASFQAQPDLGAGPTGHFSAILAR
jgi:hypothetical protein